MELNQIPQADLLDILFDGRNKSYGAYDLRKSYNRRLTKAISITVSLCLLLIFGYVLAGKLERPKAMSAYVSDPFVLVHEPIAEKKLIVPVPIHKAAPQLVATINDAVTRIVPDAAVKPNERPPTQEQLDDHVKLGTITREGLPDEGLIPTVQSDGVGKDLLDKPVQKESETDDGIVPVEIQSYYIGGTAAWTRFLTKTLRYPDAAVNMNIQGTVMVQFVVDKEGMITDVEAISGPEELRAEAVRAIRKTQGKWYPGIQNGRKVKSYKKQPITFVMGENN